MATRKDIEVAAAINILSALAFFVAFAILRLQPINDRVYFPKWYLKGLRSSPLNCGAFAAKFVNLDFKSYIRFLNWMPAALQMPEPELIDHAGLDSAVYLRIYLVGLKIFVPIAFLAFAIMVPVNWTNGTLEHSKLAYSDIDKLSISNISIGSQRFWTHLVMAYVFTFWTCYVLKKEYEIVASMRLHFLASEHRRPDQFTVLVRNVPPDPDESVNELVEHFFLVNHPEHYLTHQVVYNANKLSELVKEKKKVQNWLDYYKIKYSRNQSKRPSSKTGFLGMCGEKVDAIDFNTSKIEKLSEEIASERERIISNHKSIMPAAFVSFKSRWGAAVCAQTQQSRNPTIWLTEWAPEPRDVYWDNLAIPYVSLSIRRLIVAIAFFFLAFCFMIPIAFVQSLANIEDIEKVLPFLKPIIEMLKIFVPIAFLAFAIMVPVNWTNGTLEHSKLAYSDIDKLSISNISIGSQRFWTHLVMAYVFTFWTCYVLKKEYEIVASMRLHFLASEHRRPDQFTVLVRNVPPDPDESVNELVEHFFLVNHPEHYLTHQVVYNANKLSELVKEKKKVQNWLDYYKIKYSRNQSKRPSSKTGFLGMCGEKVDAIDFNTSKIEKLSEEIASERERIISNHKSIMPAAFVSFKSRWGAAVCAQTQQSRNPTIWLTEWAPEPRDVYWDNLAIPYVSLSIRRLIVAIAFFFLAFCFMIPIAFVQSLANIEDIEKVLPFLKPIIEMKGIKSFIQGFLPGIALKIFLIFLPSILMLMSKFEGFICISALERRSATRYYIFQFINVFLGSIITGTAFQQLNNFIHQSANEIPKTIGVSIPMKATFFITYIMVDGWAGVAGEILRLKPLIIYHLKNFFLVKTEKDREEAMDPGTLGFNTGEPQIQLYFLLGLVYAVVTPILLPFIIVFFGLAYVVYRHQIINVYNQEYESAAAFWPDVHVRIIVALIVSQLLLMGLLSTKQAAQSTPLLIALPVLTISFHFFCKGRYEPAFIRYPLQEAMMKDTLERAKEPNMNMKGFLQNAYLHPVFNSGDDSESDATSENGDQEPRLVPTKRQSRRNTPLPSKHSGSVSTLPEAVQDHALLL